MKPAIILALLVCLAPVAPAIETHTMSDILKLDVTGKVGLWVITVPCQNGTENVTMEVSKIPLQNFVAKIVVAPTETAPGSGVYHAVIPVNLGSTADVFRVVTLQKDLSRTQVPNGGIPSVRRGLQITTTEQSGS